MLALVCLGTDAKRKDNKPAFELRKHEFSLGMGVVPTKSVIDGYNYLFMKDYGLRYITSLTNTYINASTYEIEKAYPLFSINYFYNKSRLSAFGASVSYEGGYNAFYKYSDDSLINKENKNIITAMVYYRLSWLNRPYVRMYSLIGMGASFSLEGDLRNENRFAMQVSPIGISVGKQLFGFAEAGLGTNYFGINFGIGYRF